MPLIVLIVIKLAILSYDTRILNIEYKQAETLVMILMDDTFILPDLFWGPKSKPLNERFWTSKLTPF